jgi:Flp pilus assembly pilin Flp
MQRGNVLSEYGLLLGLLAVMLIGVLSLLGKSNAGLLGNLAQSAGSSQVQSMVQLQFNASGQSGGSHSTAAGATIGSLAPIGDTAGVSVNTTSVEGQKKQITAQTISYGDELETLAKGLPQGSDLQLWLTMDIIPRVRSLAAVEGYASNISTLKDTISGSYSADKATADLTELRNELAAKTQNFSYMQPGDKAARIVSPSPELEAAVVGILNQAIAGTKTFGITSEPGPYTGIIQIASAYDSNTSATNLVNRPYSSSSGYLAIVQGVQQAQADGSITQNTETATSAENADNLTDTATKLP